MYWLLCFVVLCLVYSIGDRIQGLRYARSQVLTEYLLMSFVVMCVVVFVVPLLTWWCNRLVIWMSVIIQTVGAFVTLCFLAGFIASSDELLKYWPINRIDDFFGRLEFFTFALEYAPIVSVLAGMYYTWIGRNRVVTPPSAERFATRGRPRERNRDG